MYNKLNTLNINLTEEKKELFDKYISLFLNYNENVNLISNNDSKVLFEKHIFDSLAMNLFLTNKKIKVLDIGTGGGFPSIPLALVFDEMQISAVDSINKKINFINHAKSELNINNIKPICSRVEDLPENLKNSFDIVTTRAMADLREILEYAIPYTKVGGYFIAYKSLKANEELDNAKNALKSLNAVLIDKIEYNLPIEENNSRVLLIFKKNKNVLDCYPRKNGLVKKKPL
ncbi:MAG: 16S rRNA (guanine(527)-N(7))-methyltransferase RsmG [Cyanobacteria bacterium SIG29]|nr:16S rRNA (guanine(527)-N(7))-methyltransferase RsmG [Cyanobacteria bacterium SIG29]